jgi:hypothetical protein
MTLLRRTRTEVAGAWRSLRYDLGRRTEQPPPGGREPEPDVTSTGMSTFGGVTGTGRSGPGAGPAYDGPGYHGPGYDGPGYDGPGYGEPARPRRTLVAAGAFLTLAVVGAAGSYLAVVTGLGGLLRDEPAAADQRPLAAAVRPGDTAAGADATSGLGRGPAEAPVAATAQPVPPPKVQQPATVPAPARPAQPPARPARPGTPTREDCDCLTPPVPTPTAPPSASPSPSASSSTAPSPSEFESSDPADPTAEPSESHNGSPERRVHRHG